MSELNPSEPPKPAQPLPEPGPALDPEPPLPPAPQPETENGRTLPLLGVLAFLVLLGGVVWLWRDNIVLNHRLTALEHAPPPVDPARIGALENAVDSLRQQVAGLAAQPAAAAMDVKLLEQRVSALEHRPAPPPAPDLAPLESKVAALQKKPSVAPAEFSKLEARVAALENKPAVTPEDPALKAQVQQLAAAQAAAARQASATQQQAAATLQQVQAAQQQLKTAQQQAGAAQQQAGAAQQQASEAGAAAKASAARAARLQRVQQAQAALEAGKPLGSLPGAPPALARFADAAPPTEAALRLSFPAAAQQAEAASVPSTSGLSFAQRMWQRAQNLVTVREGDKVIVGAPASATLAAAKARLDAGDLAGAVATLGKLDPPAAKAMAPWRAQAQALLGARAALAQQAAG